MSELRMDPATKEWIVFATERARRPHEFQRPVAVAPQLASVKRCPFCPGNEDLTPQAISTDEISGVWRVRVVPNRFPAFRIEDEIQRQTHGPLFVSMGGVGAHEVIIETPDHGNPLPFLSEQRVADIVRAFLQRSRDLANDPRFKLILIFKNHGVDAGTSIEHPHCQLIATPVVPQQTRHKYDVAMQYYDDTGSCLYCEILHAELSCVERIIERTENFAVFHPFASRVPFETWIMPTRHQPSFASMEDSIVPSFAGLLKRTLLRLHSALGEFAYNMVSTLR